MFDTDKLSEYPVPSRYVGAGSDQRSTRLVCITDGPHYYQDPSKGAKDRVWKSFLRDFKFYLGIDGDSEDVVFSNPCSLVTDFSFCFNQNADLHLCYTEQDTVYWQWYDAATGKFTTTQMPEGTRSARCVLDDTRNSQTNRSDIILAYIREDGALCFTKQRDRFGIEYLLDVGPYVSLEKMYMNSGWRLQFECVVGEYNKPEVEVLKNYARYLLTPVRHDDYSGYKLGVFDTGYIFPSNQTLDTVVSNVTGVFWEYLEGGAIFTVNFDIKPTANLPYFYVHIGSLELKLYHLGSGTYAAQLDEQQVQLLDSIPTTTIQLLFEYPDVTNVTQEF